MDAWDNALLARHQKRPYTLDYVRDIFDELGGFIKKTIFEIV